MRPSTNLKIQNSSLLWEVTHPDVPGTSYIFGTVHLAHPDVAQLIPLHILESVTTVILEVDILSKLSDGKKVGALPAETLDAYYPYFENTLSLAEFKKLSINELFSYLSGLGRPRPFIPANFEKYIPDVRIQIEASRQKKKLIFLDTIDYQETLLATIKNQFGLSWFNFDDIENNIQSILAISQRQAEILHDGYFSLSDESFSPLLTAYLKQDIKTCRQLLQSVQQNSPELSAQIYVKREEAWYPRLNSAFEAGHCFIAVGVVHVEEILKFARQSGFSIKPIVNYQEVLKHYPEIKESLTIPLFHSLEHHQKRQKEEMLFLVDRETSIKGLLKSRAPLAFNLVKAMASSLRKENFLIEESVLGFQASELSDNEVLNGIVQNLFKGDAPGIPSAFRHFMNNEIGIQRQRRNEDFREILYDSYKNIKKELTIDDPNRMCMREVLLDKLNWIILSLQLSF